jgi:hypothetical protein
VIVTFLERLCSSSGHRFRPLCSYVVRRDDWWLGRNQARATASETHRQMRDRYESAMIDLPFPSAADVPAPAEPDVPAPKAAAAAAPAPAPLTRRRGRQAKSA